MMAVTNHFTQYPDKLHVVKKEKHNQISKETQQLTCSSGMLTLMLPIIDSPSLALTHKHYHRWTKDYKNAPINYSNLPRFLYIKPK